MDTAQPITLSSLSTFEFPRIHTFPPLYTKQPNQTIQQQQLESWTNIILSYCEFYKITSLTSEGQPRHSQLFSKAQFNLFPLLFENKSINRHVNADFKTTILTHLIHTKKAEYINLKRPELGIFIYWRSVVDWGNILYDYISNTGQKGTVMTLYELTKGGAGGGEIGASTEEDGLGEDNDNYNYTDYNNNNNNDDDDENLLPSELKNMDELLLIKVIQEYLVKQGKAQVLLNEYNQIGGVKIV
ncbi:conserved hypothetical protein [Lodderomyces elongisporus NRRL YB-4239]|uniref:Vacuolar protein-sorting-associated protein 25 n=1 Tax=Lodderomyces elongisporus (strain ATCC 11503 / CBS 2605 / JCM 1781 / NBRC 1676 / NRRL YB-4239) TaxID=379508 RepID=A5E382_LODEL|nr:conserved hypothetical protein [Lodderomyces elongisporus NRRL YB-4239]